jgi:hypothetical protein
MLDDLMSIGSNPQAFYVALINGHGWQLKGVGQPSYHLGGDFLRDPDGTLAWGAHSYVKKMLHNYEIMFDGKPKEYTTPMAEKYHPELDTSDLLDSTGIKQYESLIEALQWLITVGRFDIHLCVTTMSGYRVAPRQGHLDCLKRTYGYPRSVILMVQSASVQKSLIMKVLSLPSNMTGHPLSMVKSRKSFLQTCLFPKAKLCALHTTKTQTSTMSSSLDEQCLV